LYYLTSRPAPLSSFPSPLSALHSPLPLTSPAPFRRSCKQPAGGTLKTPLTLVHSLQGMEWLRLHEPSCFSLPLLKSTTKAPALLAAFRSSIELTSLPPRSLPPAEILVAPAAEELDVAPQLPPRVKGSDLHHLQDLMGQALGESSSRVHPLVDELVQD